MLILTRKLGENIDVKEGEGEEVIIKIHILDIRGGQVKLGFKASPRYIIDREEITQRKAGRLKPTPSSGTSQTLRPIWPRTRNPRGKKARKIHREARPRV